MHVRVRVLAALGVLTEVLSHWGGRQWHVSPPVTVTFYTVTLRTLLSVVQRSGGLVPPGGVGGGGCGGIST